MATNADPLTDAEVRFASEVRRMRESKGWTQAELASQVRDRALPHVNQTTISRIEQQLRPVRLVEAQALAEVFGRTVRSMQNPGRLDELVGAMEQRLAELDRRRAELTRLRAEVVSRYVDLVFAAAELESSAQADPTLGEDDEQWIGRVVREVRYRVFSEDSEIRDAVEAETPKSPGSREHAGRRK